MQRPSASFPPFRLPNLAAPWAPLAIASSLWMLALLFGGALLAPLATRRPWGNGPLAELEPWEMALALAVVGFLSGSALPPFLRSPLLAGLTVALVLVWGSVLLTYQLTFSLASTPLVVGLGLAGLLFAFLLGGLAAPRLHRATRDFGQGSGRTLGLLAIAGGLVSILIPFGTANFLSGPFELFPPAQWAIRIPQQVYALFKIAMLWIPLGFLFALGERPQVLRRWVPAGIAGFLLMVWPFADALKVSDLLEVIGIPVGVWIGLWVGGQLTAGVTAERSDAAALHAESGADTSRTSVPEELPTMTRTAQLVPTAAKALRQVADRIAAALAIPDGMRARTTATGWSAFSSRSEQVQPEQPDPQVPGQAAPVEQTWRGHIAVPRPYPAALLPALALLALAAWGWWDFPRYQLPLGIALLLYALLVIFARHVWMAAIPALLPALDLAPWTGHFFFDATDLFLLVTLGAAALHRPDPRAGVFLAKPIAILLGLFAGTTLIALLVGLVPLSPLDANAFATYFSHYNALRIAKGFAWGLAVFLLLRWTVPKGSDLPARLLTAGLLLGLAAVILVGLRERWQFAALLDFAETYRITATFSSMHTGGSHLPAFLALAVPFVWLWIMRLRNGNRHAAKLAASLAIGLVLFAGALYLVVSTVTRAAVLALAVELALLTLFWLRGLRGQGARLAVSSVAFLGMAAIAGSVVYLGTQGSYFQHRASMVERDADTRLTHWRQAVWMMDRDLLTPLFGMGLGTFPETYLKRNPDGSVPGNFRYAFEAGNGHLLLGSGETLYLAQRVPIRPGTEYRLAFDLKGRGGDLRLTIPLCEKHLLDSRNCVWKTYQLPGSGQWERKEVTVESGRVGRGGWLDGPPVELFLYNGEEDQLVAVDNLSLRAADGTELLRNGDFSAGGDFWFFKTHDHLAWHIKNLWVSLLFEQGWAGLVVFNLLMLGALLHLFGPAWRGSPTAAAVLTAVVGFLTVGLFASPFDAPRLTALFFTVLATGLYAVPAVPVAKRTRRPKLRWRKKSERKRPSRSAHGNIA